MVDGIQIEGEPVKRGPGRPPLRETVRMAETVREDTRSASVREAEEYARQVMDALGTDNFNLDEFYISPEEVPEGWAYEWKAASIAGKDNTYRMLELHRLGWRPVQAERHPYKMPQGYEGPISIKGLVLMEMPKVLTDKANRAHIRESKDVLRNSEAQLYETPANTAPRDDAGLTRAGLNKVTRDYVSSRPARGDD